MKSAAPSERIFKLNPPKSNWLSAGLILLLIFFNALRFVHLGADFPLDISRSGSAYTDEGWYSSGVINARQWGHWYLVGDFNPSVNMPVGELFQAITIRVFGLSLWTARLNIALSSIAIILCAYGLCRQYLRNSWAATLTALAIAANYSIFAHSRVALMELPSACLAMLAVSILLLPKKVTTATAFGAAVLLSLGVLTKGTAIAALPALLYLAATRASGKRSQWGSTLLLGATFVGLTGAYIWWASHSFPVDYGYFQTMNIAERAATSTREFLSSLRGAVQQLMGLDKRTSNFFALALLFFSITSPRFRSSPLVHAALLWLLSSLTLLGVIRYHPERYFVPLLIPAILLCGAIVDAAWDGWISQWKVPPRWFNAVFRVAPLAFMILAIGVSAWKIARTMARPAYTFTAMSHDVGRILSSDGLDNGTPPLLFGDLAHSIALEARVRPVNSTEGPSSLQWRLNHFQPRYYIARGKESLTPILARRTHLVKVAQWNVYSNYYNGFPVTLYRVSHPGQAR